MIGRSAVLAGRIRQDVAEIERVVERVERVVQARRRQTAEQDLLLDSVTLNLRGFSTCLERIFTHIASGVDQSSPTGPDWHRELLRQMTVDVPGLRSPVITAAVAAEVASSSASATWSGTFTRLSSIRNGSSAWRAGCNQHFAKSGPHSSRSQRFWNVWRTTRDLLVQ